MVGGLSPGGEGEGEWESLSHGYRVLWVDGGDRLHHYEGTQHHRMNNVPPTNGLALTGDRWLNAVQRHSFPIRLPAAHRCPPAAPLSRRQGCLFRVFGEDDFSPSDSRPCPRRALLSFDGLIPKCQLKGILSPVR